MPYRQTLPHARSRHSDDRAGTATTTYDYVAGCAHLLRNPPVNCAAAHFLVDFVHFATQIRQELAAAYLGTKRNESLVLRSCVKRSRLQKDCCCDNLATSGVTLN